MSTVGKVIGAVSVAGGVVGAAILGGVTAQRHVVRRYRQMVSESDESFDSLPADRTYSVVAADGVVLHVEEVGPRDAALTVVFSHGWTLRSGAWHFQRTGLAGPDFGLGDTEPAGIGLGATGKGADQQARLVFYDQRSHGRSSRAGAGHSTIADLASDLAAVLATAAPDGPVVIVGHSMGGMALITLAGIDPEYFADRVVGVGLLSTSASELPGADAGWMKLNGGNSLLSVVAATAARYPRIFERGRTSGHDAVWLLTRQFGFASPTVPAGLVDYLDQMISDTPVDVIAEFAPSVFAHDQIAALPALSEIATLILCGDADRMTPLSRSQTIADALPKAEFVVVPGAGHMAIMEAPEVVNDALRALLRRAAVTARRASTARGRR